MERQQAEDFKTYRERLKSTADWLKTHLQGRVIKAVKPERRGRLKTHDTNAGQKTILYLNKYRQQRKTRNKTAYRSRRVNRMRKCG